MSKDIQAQKINKERILELSSTDFLKIRGDDNQYKEAIQQSVKFNRQFIRDRKARIPVLDAQTRITQDNCTLWDTRYLRQDSIKKGQVYKYNVKKWIKSRRIIFHKDLNRNFTDQVRDSETEATQENNLKPSPQYVAASNSIENSSWFDDSYENFEMDLDNDERISRKKANRKKGKQNTEDKLFFCDKCGAKYKTKQRMGYHMEKSHGIKSDHDENTNNSASGSIWEEGNSIN